MDHDPAEATEHNTRSDAFALDALRAAVRRRSHSHDDRGPSSHVPQVRSTPLQMAVPDEWVAYAWGAGARILGTVEDPVVTYACDVARERQDPTVAAEIVARDLANPPVDGPSGGDPEYLSTDFAVGAFLATLGRSPTPEDLDHHINLLRAGLAPALILEGLIRSDESHRALRHPRPWHLYRGESAAASMPSLGGRARSMLASLGTPATHLSDIEARLNALADAQWRLSARILDQLAPRADDLRRAPVEGADAMSNRSAPDQSATEPSRTVAAVAADVSTMLRTVAQHGIVARELLGLTAESAGVASTAVGLSVRLTLRVLPPGTQRLGDLATALAPIGWDVALRPIERVDLAETSDELAISRILTA